MDPMKEFKHFMQSLKARYKRARRDSDTISGLAISASSRRRAAICYLTSPFTSGFARPLPNEVNIRNIVGIFLEFGYIVDIYDYDHKLNAHRNYDVVFGLGQSFASSVEHANHKNALKILYLTEMPPHYSQGVEGERYERLKSEGLNITLKNKRSHSYYNDMQLRISDGVIAIGSNIQREIISSQVGVEVSVIQPAILTGMLPQLKTEGERAINEYCWIGSSGALLKGLDLLIKAFNADSQKKLHLFGLSEGDKVFLNLVQGVNIIDHGFHSVDSDHFQSVVSKCSFVISSSFSEGASTGVITGMGMGCIPVVSRFCGTEFFENFGVIIEDMTTDGVLNAIREADKGFEATSEVSRLRMATYVRAYYSEDAYRMRLSQAIRLHLNNDQRIARQS